MKKYIIGILGLAALLLASCDKDNFDPPKSELTGKVVFNNQAIGLRQTDEAVQMQLWQDGYALYEPISVYLSQDGTFSALLFNGTYKLVTRDGNGPWVNDRDTVIVKVSGKTTVEYPVKPYFMLSNEDFKINGNTLTASFSVNEITAGKKIERITLYVHNTIFVDEATKLKEVNASSYSTGAQIIAADISDILSKPILYARIGLKIEGIDQLLYTTGSIRIK